MAAPTSASAQPTIDAVRDASASADRTTARSGTLLDQRPLFGEIPSRVIAKPTAEAPASGPAVTAPASLRDARQISTARLQDVRGLTGSPAAAPLPTAATMSASTAPPAMAGATVAADRTASLTVGTVAPQPVSGHQPCVEAVVTTTPLDGGLMRVIVASGCRANQDVQLSYGGAVLIRRLDASGNLDFTLDCFAGTGSDLNVAFADGSRQSKPVTANDIDKVSKIAVIWQAPVNLDLHAFEYAASYGRAGHVWERASPTLVTAREVAMAGRRGRGALSTSDDGRTLGDKLEVYTFQHHEAQTGGVVAMSLDYETRGDLPSGMTCGAGAFAEISYQVVVLGRGKAAARESGVLSPAPCGVKIGPNVRFDPLLLPSLRVQR